MNIALKACPFCGMHSSIGEGWEDTMYPTGFGWREDKIGTESIRHYIGRNDPRAWHGACYEINCATAYGGCGANITADSKEEVIAKWNRRV